MLLIGSKAALARNALPSWRRGHVDDLDLRGTKDELDALLGRLKAFYGDVTVKESSKFPGKFMVNGGFAKDMGRIEYDATMLPSYRLLDRLPDSCTVALFGLVVKVPSVRTLYLMKRSHINFSIHWPKNFKDMIFFADRIDLGWRDGWDDSFSKEHLEAYEALRKEAFDRYSHTQDRIKLKKTETEFFNQSANCRQYVHDDIHRAVAFTKAPMFERFKTDQDSPMLSQDLFEKARRGDRLALFLEEAMVVGIERFYLPDKKLDERRALRAGAAKLLHTMCKGWFQDFGLDHAHMVKHCKWDFIARFERALEQGKIRLQNDIS